MVLHIGHLRQVLSTFYQQGVQDPEKLSDQLKVTQKYSWDANEVPFDKLCFSALVLSPLPLPFLFPIPTSPSMLILCSILIAQRIPLSMLNKQSCVD